MAGPADKGARRLAHHVDGVLLLYNGLYPGPPDIPESVRAFERCSRYPVFPVDLFFGYPDGLDRARFQAVVLHYTMFYTDLEPLSDRVRDYLARDSDAFKVAFLQDEQAFLRQQLDFCNRYGIDCVYTCIQPPYAARVYGSTPASQIVSYIPGYVGGQLRRTARRMSAPDKGRPIDVGYRGRKAPAEWGAAAREKYEIAIEFARRAEGTGLVLDIETAEDRRLYGRAWPRFIARCKGMLGTESGATIPDPLGSGDIPYRTISPRHFEAAALRTCQILYEGEYSSILVPGVHYIPLKKDFSNFDDVLAEFRRPERRRELTENAFRDLIASERHSYSTFVRSFDSQLDAAGLEAPVHPSLDRQVSALLFPPRTRARRRLKAARLAVFLARRAWRARLARVLSGRSAPQP